MTKLVIDHVAALTEPRPVARAQRDDRPATEEAMRRRIVRAGA